MAATKQVKKRTKAQVKQAFKDYMKEKLGRDIDPDNPDYSAGYNDWLKTQPEWNETDGIAQFAPEENRQAVANSEAEANRQEQQHRTDYDNAETDNDREARDRAQAEAAEQRRRAVLAQTSFNPPALPAKKPMPTDSTETPEVSTDQVDSFVDTSDLDNSEVPIEESKKHDYISTQVRNRKKKAATRVGKETNMETDTNTETKTFNVGEDSGKSLNAGEEPHKTLPTDTETDTNTGAETPPKTDTNTETVSEPETPPETNTETETPPEPAPAPLPEEDLNEAGVTQEDIDDGNVDETNLEAAESGAKENGFDPETADAKAIEEAEQLGTWDKVSIGLSVASSILSALTLGIIPPIDFRKFKNTDQKLEQIQQYQKDKRDAAVINNLQKEAESKGITDPQEIRQYVNDRFNSQSRNEQRTQDFNVQNKELDNSFAKGMKTLEHNLEMRKLDKQTINKIKEDTNNLLGEIKKIYAQGDVTRAQTRLEAKLKDWLAENQSQYDASTQADIFKYWAAALKEAGLPVNEENIRRMARAITGASNTTSANLDIAGVASVGGTSTN